MPITHQNGYYHQKVQYKQTNEICHALVHEQAFGVLHQAEEHPNINESFALLNSFESPLEFKVELIQF